MGDIPRRCARCGLLVETRKTTPICPDCCLTDKWYVRKVREHDSA